MAGEGANPNPTYMADIRHFFRQVDIDHMAAKNIDLSTYAGVKANASSIYTQTSGGQMPPDVEGQWDADRVQTFLNWILNNYPLGTTTAAETREGVTATP